MGLLNTVSKVAQRIVLGDPEVKKAKQKKEPPTMRMIIAEEPRPSHHQQVHDWINGSDTPPDRAIRIQTQIAKLHHADYMSFPQGEGTMGNYKVKGLQRSPHDIDGFYSDSFLNRNRNQSKRKR